MEKKVSKRFMLVLLLDDFRFQLTKEELSRCKNCILKMDPDVKSSSKSKIFILNNGGRGSNIKYMPYAFTEQGIYMLMTVLKGEQATGRYRCVSPTVREVAAR